MSRFSTFKISIAITCCLAVGSVHAIVELEYLDPLNGPELERHLAVAPVEDRGRIQVALGRFYTEQDLDEADHYFELASENLAETDLAGRSLLARGQCLSAMLRSKMEAALALCEQSVSLALDAENNFALSKAHAEMTQIYYQSGNLEGAVQQSRLALQAALPTNSANLIATQHNNMGLMLQAQGEYKASMTAFRTGLDLIATVLDDPLYYPLTFNLGVSYANLDNHELALELYEPVLAWTQEKNLFRKELIVIVYAALSDIEVGRVVEAEAALNVALSRPELMANQGYLAFVYAALGHAQYTQGKYGDALAAYETGLAIAASNPNTFEQRRLDIGYAQVLAEVGRLDEATERLSAVLTQLESEGSRHFQRSALEVMLKITRLTGDLDHSLIVFEKLMDVQKQVQLYELEQELALAHAAYEVNSKERELLAVERDNIVRNGAIMLLLAIVVIGYLFVSRRVEVQRRQVQGELAKQLEEEVDARTRELRERMVEIETAEQTRREMERQLSEADKLRVLGQLTGGVAHDFNNLLTVVIGAAELLKVGVGEAKRDDLLDHIVTAAHSGADITRALMSYARKQPLQLEALELKEFLKDRVPLLRRTMGGTVTLSLNLEDCPDTHVIIDPAQLTAALLNLSLNARDAQHNQGDIAITLAARDDQWLEIAVTDSGVGMTAEELEHAVEPFYTTKVDNQGNGLGLSMVYGFSKQSGGDLEIDSVEGEGTTVKLVLPISPSSAIEVDNIRLNQPELVEQAFDSGELKFNKSQ